MSRFGRTANRQWQVRKGVSPYAPGSQRDLIYQFIKAHPGATSDEIADALLLPAPFLSRLAELEQTGAIESHYAADLFGDKR